MHTGLASTILPRLTAIEDELERRQKIRAKRERREAYRYAHTAPCGAD